MYKSDMRGMESRAIRWMKGKKWVICVNERENLYTRGHNSQGVRVALFAAFPSNIDLYRSCQPGGVSTGAETVRLFPKRKDIRNPKLTELTGNVVPNTRIMNTVNRG